MASHEWHKLFFVLRSLLLILLIGCAISKQQPHQCGTGIPSPGYTVPAGYIILEYGETLDILCVLHEEKAAYYGPNPSSLMSITVFGERQPIDVVNSSAIRLYIENHPKTKSSDYACMINGTFVCHNLVIVGTKPRPVIDFNCIGYNYENLTCAWTASENYVKTDYQLAYSPSASARPAAYNKSKTVQRPRFTANCPNIIYKDLAKKTLSCTWSFSTIPQYRHSHEYYKFFLEANNIFGNETCEFPLNHYSHVVPNAPENLTANATSPHSIKLRWLIPIGMQSFPGGIEYRVSWWIKFTKQWVTLPYIKMEKIDTRIVEYELTDLPYAHYLYDIKVSMKSLQAKNEGSWSENSSVMCRTKSKLPDGPPRTDIGSFEIQQGVSSRIVYWQDINDYEKNGQFFTYHITVEGHPDIKPKECNSNYAIFENMTDNSYTVKIWAKNELGLSDHYSTVFIPAPDQALELPSKLVMVEKGHGVYDLEWEINDDPRATNYTIFWCAVPKSRPYQCETLNWTIVDQGTKTLTVQPDQYSGYADTPNDYQFAISANGYRISSGMLWAECTSKLETGIRLGEFIGKVDIQGFLEVTAVWKLKCVKMEDVRGFNISYCPVVHKSERCQDDSLKYMLINDPGAEKWVIKDLGIYNRYKIDVKLVLNDADSQLNEPMVNSTFKDVR